MNVARVSRELHAVVGQYPWSRADYPGCVVHAPGPSPRLPEPERSRGWLALIRERRAYADPPCDLGPGDVPRWQSRYLTLRAAHKVRRALAVLPDLPQRPHREYWPSIEGLLAASGQTEQALQMSRQRTGFEKLALAVATGEPQTVRALLPKLSLEVEEDCSRLALAYSQSRTQGREVGLQTLMAVFGASRNFGPEWTHCLSAAVLHWTAMTDPVHFSDAVRPSKESLRCLWLGLTRVSFSTLDKIFEMGPERCRYALQTDRPYSPSLRALCRHTLAYPHCQKLRYILNEKAWPTYEDDGARSRSREKRAALLEVMGRRELLLSTAHGCAPAYVLTRLLADGYRAAHVRESHLAVSSLRGMLVLWRHAAGAGYISMLMRQMLAESVLFGPHSAALEGGVLTAFAEAGGQLSAGEIACALLAASKSAHHGPYTRARAGGATAARQKRATRLIEDAGLQGALAPFSPSDQRWLQELFPGAEYGGALCLRARQMAADPAAPAPRSRGNPRPGHSRGLEGR